MEGWFSSITEWFREIFQAWVDWQYQLVVDAFAYFILISAKIAYESAIASLEFAVAVAASIIEELDFNSVINGYYQQLPPDVYSLLNYIGFPAAVNMILSALTLKFVMGKLGVLS